MSTCPEKFSIKSAPAMPVGQPYYTLKQLAKFLGMSERTIQRWQKAGKAPPRTKRHGRYVYLADAVYEWMAAKVSPLNGSTKNSEPGAQALKGGVPAVEQKTPLCPKPFTIKEAKAASHARAMLRRIRKAHEAGKTKQIERFTRQYLCSLDARYIAVVEAYRGLKPHRRPKPGSLLGFAQGLNAWAGTKEQVILILKDKGNGHFRDIKDFGIENRALQALVLPVLEILGKRHPNQYAMQGVHAAITRVAALMAKGYVWAIETDIENCYPSFDGEKVQELLPLPKKVTHNALLCASLNVSLGNASIFGPADPGEDDETSFPELFADAWRGIPQGSVASNLVAEILLATVFDQLPTNGQCVGYADNFLAMGKTKKDAASMTSALWSALKAHPAGQLRPKEPKVFKKGGPIDFLGHRLTRVGQKIKIEPTPENRHEYHVKFDRGFSRIINAKTPKARAKRAEELRRLVCSWCAAFKLWDQAVSRRSKDLIRIKKLLKAI